MYGTRLFKFILLLVAWPIYAQLITITGTWKNPDGTTLNGKAVISLPRATVTNSCVTPSQVTSFRQISIAITNGTLGALSLYPSSCLSPPQPCQVLQQLTAGCYAIAVYNSLNQILYRSNLIVASSPSTQNITAIDVSNTHAYACYLPYVGTGLCQQ